MNSKTYGYICVSTRKQNEDRQRIALIVFGIDPRNIMMDKKSGKDFDRPGYRRLCKKSEAGRHSDHQKYRPAGKKL